MPADVTPHRLTDTELAVLGTDSAADALAVVDGYVRERLGAPIELILFRAGRIDVVWALRLDDGRDVVVKGHRPPVDVPAVAAAQATKNFLHERAFPCPAPLSGPDDVAGHVLTCDTMLSRGTRPDGRDPHVRRLLATGLYQHVDALRSRPDLIEPAGRGPSWCRYGDGPWPQPHDPIVDFTSTPPGYAWLDEFAEHAAEQIRAGRRGADVLVGHADWYAGNVIAADGVLTGTFDWELVADTEAVIAGFAAAGFAASSSSGWGLSSPDEVVTFLRDYEAARGAPFAPEERAAAAGASAWIVAFNARWELGMGEEESPSLRLARDSARRYLELSW